MRRVLVCGGRDFGTDGPDGPEYNFIIETLEKLAEEWCPGYPSNEQMLPYDIHIISGGARGVDTVAIDWAVVNWLTFVEFSADWSRYGKAAGYIRNKHMLTEGKPDVVVAFPGGKGTANMVKLAENAGVPVIKVLYKREGENPIG